MLSSKHKQSKEAVAKRQPRELDNAQATGQYDHKVNPAGETAWSPKDFLSKGTNFFLKAGECLCQSYGTFVNSSLQQHAYKLIDDRDMSDLIPFVSQKNPKEIRPN